MVQQDYKNTQTCLKNKDNEIIIPNKTLKFTLLKIENNIYNIYNIYICNIILK